MAVLRHAHVGFDYVRAKRYRILQRLKRILRRKLPVGTMARNHHAICFRHAHRDDHHRRKANYKFSHIHFMISFPQENALATVSPIMR